MKETQLDCRYSHPLEVLFDMFQCIFSSWKLIYKMSTVLPSLDFHLLGRKSVWLQLISLSNKILWQMGNGIRNISGKCFLCWDECDSRACWLTADWTAVKIAIHDLEQEHQAHLNSSPYLLKVPLGELRLLSRSLSGSSSLAPTLSSWLCKWALLLTW